MRLHDIVLGNLRRRKGRMLFLVLGLALGVGTVVMLRSLTSAMEREIGAQLDQYGANIVIVPASKAQEVAYGGITISTASYDAAVLHTDALKAIRSISYRSRLSIIAPKLLGEVDAEGRRLLLAGVDFREELKMKQWWQISGRVPDSSYAVLLGWETAQVLGVIRAPELPLGNTALHKDHSSSKAEVALRRDSVTIRGREFKIAGVLQETGGQDDRMLFVGLPEAQQILGKPDELSLIEVSALCQGCPIEDIVAQLRAALPQAKVAAVQQAVKSRVQTVARLSQFSTALAVAMAFIGALLVFVTMMASVVERTREIGVMRALGFRKSHIGAIILGEAAVVSLAGGIVGGVLGTATGLLAAQRFSETTTAVELPVSMLMFSVIAAVCLGVASSLYPAVRAAKLEPSEALRYF